MKVLYCLLSFSLCLVFFSSCQEEELSKTSTRGYSDLRNPPAPSYDPKSGTFTGYTQANEYVNFFYPRFPRPLPCPVLAGCRLPRPLLQVSVPQGVIYRLEAKLYTEDGQLYACSGKECGGFVDYQKDEALASLTVINEKVKSNKLFMELLMSYEVNGKRYSEKFTDENVPLSLDMYTQVDQVMYRLPRLPRPRPCPVLSGCMDPKPELHVIIPRGKVLKLEAKLLTKDGETYACSSKRCEGQLESSPQEALATLNVVNPGIKTENLILVFHITYEVNGKIFSKEIYDEDIPIGMD